MKRTQAQNIKDATNAFVSGYTPGVMTDVYFNIPYIALPCDKDGSPIKQTWKTEQPAIIDIIPHPTGRKAELPPHVGKSEKINKDLLEERGSYFSEQAPLFTAGVIYATPEHGGRLHRWSGATTWQPKYQQVMVGGDSGATDYSLPIRAAAYCEGGEVFLDLSEYKDILPRNAIIRQHIDDSYYDGSLDERSYIGGISLKDADLRKVSLGAHVQVFKTWVSD